jgi:protein-disulfide isomerase
MAATTNIVLDQLDYAVELGVLTLPSIVIDGKLVFTSMPTATQLHAALIVGSDP